MKKIEIIGCFLSSFSRFTQSVENHNFHFDYTDVGHKIK